MNKYQIHLIIEIAILSAVLGAIAFMGGGLYLWGKSDCNKPTEAQEMGLVMVQGNSLQAISPPFFPQIQVLGALVGSDSEDLFWKIWQDYPELYRIIECESNWKSVCNKNGCKYGQGLGQIIPTTWKRMQQEIGVGDDPLNPEDNLRATLWLYENEGNRHWGFEGAEWGSWTCWHN